MVWAAQRPEWWAETAKLLSGLQHATRDTVLQEVKEIVLRGEGTPALAARVAAGMPNVLRITVPSSASSSTPVGVMRELEHLGIQVLCVEHPDWATTDVLTTFPGLRELRVAPGDFSLNHSLFTNVSCADIAVGCSALKSLVLQNCDITTAAVGALSRLSIILSYQHVFAGSEGSVAQWERDGIT